jgi:hypothetical protein
MLEFIQDGKEHVKVVRDGIFIGWINREVRAPAGLRAEKTVRYDARIENNHFSDARLCIVKQQIRDILADHIEITEKGLTAMQQAAAIFAAARSNVA